jgi:hypothetical protein
VATDFCVAAVYDFAIRMVALRGMIFPLAGWIILGNVMRRDIAAEYNLGELNITLFYATHSQLHAAFVANN